MENIILTHKQIEQKIDRIAYQILEDNIEAKTIHIIGIANTGYEVAKAISDILNTISNSDINLHKLTINKRNSVLCLTEDTNFTIEKNAIVILVDDVLNTGETLMHASYIILKHKVAKFRTAVLLDRRHRLFPIKADFAGLTLSTTIENHIEVEVQDGKFKALLK